MVGKFLDCDFRGRRTGYKTKQLTKRKASNMHLLHIINFLACFCARKSFEKKKARNDFMELSEKAAQIIDYFPPLAKQEKCLLR